MMQPYTVYMAGPPIPGGHQRMRPTATPAEYLGELIRVERRARGLSQEVLAGRVGCSTITISRLERGHAAIHLPRVDLLHKLSDVLEIPLDVLSTLASGAWPALPWQKGGPLA
jgi:ribosome-binding protein aMBF1 (putative translation factor)